MSRPFRFAVMSAAACLALVLSFCGVGAAAGTGAQALEAGLREAYSRKDYAKAASVLDAQVRSLTESFAKGDKTAAWSELRGKSFELAALYAWWLGRPDDAIEIYRRTSAIPRPYSDEDDMPSLEPLFIADIYEFKKDYTNALKYYESLLDKLEARRPKKQFDELVGTEIKTLLKYRIDGINAAAGSSKKNLLPKFRFSPFRTNTFSGLFLPVFAPSIVWLGDFETVGRSDTAEFIRKSPKGIGYVFANYFFVVNVSAGTFNDASEKAAAAYLETYPNELPSLWLRHLLYAFYTKNGKPEKAALHKAEIEKIGGLRRMEVLVGPDKRFSSPEATFATLKKAMSEGDIETISECYVLGSGVMVEFLRAKKPAGKDVFKKAAESMVEIRRESGDGQRATYLTIGRVNGKETSVGHMIFNNVDGEWKLGR